MQAKVRRRCSNARHENPFRSLVLFICAFSPLGGPFLKVTMRTSAGSECLVYWSARWRGLEQASRQVVIPNTTLVGMSLVGSGWRNLIGTDPLNLFHIADGFLYAFLSGYGYMDTSTRSTGLGAVPAGGRCGPPLTPPEMGRALLHVQDRKLEV